MKQDNLMIEEIRFHLNECLMTLPSPALKKIIISRMSEMCVSLLSNELYVGCILFFSSQACSLWVRVCADVCAWASTYACVCLVSDFSVANPSVGLRGPSGDVFSADITSPGRPLIRSQSFHNAPGKWPLRPAPWS